MRKIKVFGCGIYFAAALAALVFGVVSLLITPGIISVWYILANTIFFALSLPLILNILTWVGRRMSRGFISVSILLLIFLYPLSPIWLIISVVRAVVSFVKMLGTPYIRDIGAAEYTEEERRAIYHNSAREALIKILDEDNHDIVTFDDGITATRLRQVALVELGENRYVLLSPVGDTRAFAYAIRMKEGGERTLVPVKSRDLYARIFAAYKETLSAK